MWFRNIIKNIFEFKAKVPQLHKAAIVKQEITSFDQAKALDFHNTTWGEEAHLAIIKLYSIDWIFKQTHKVGAAFIFQNKIKQQWVSNKLKALNPQKDINVILDVKSIKQIDEWHFKLVTDNLKYLVDNEDNFSVTQNRSYKSFDNLNKYLLRLQHDIDDLEFTLTGETPV